MNSYFEQGGFYGQASAAAAGGDPAYRFPLGLAGMGMSPYAQHQPRPQDYDVAAAAAVSAASAVTSPKSSGLYSPLNNDASSVYKSSSTTSSGSGGGGGTGVPPSAPSSDPSQAAALAAAAASAAAAAQDCKDQTNGYASLSKELNAWGSSTPTSAGVVGSHSSSASANGGVRPSSGTPDMTRYTPSAVDAVSARDRWMNSCSLTGSQAQQAALSSQAQQSAHQTFYPWMAIAGKSYFLRITISLSMYVPFSSKRGRGIRWLLVGKWGQIIFHFNDMADGFMRLRVGYSTARASGLVIS